MKTNHKKYKTLYIDITTYRAKRKSKKVDKNMNTGSTERYKSQHKFICSICLNQNSVNDVKETEVPEFNERKSKSCPVCHCSCSYNTDDGSTLTKRSKSKNDSFEDDDKVVKNIQTSHADVSQGLTLLNEVLNVFQNKKKMNNVKEKRTRTLIFKDVGVSTEDINYKNVKPKLSRSKLFQFSIEDNVNSENKFTIVSSSQPETIFVSHKSLDLINHKSSSIPQMKLEELKHSLKAKTKSKDIIEEADRMFAAVKRVDENNSIENRPMVRNGPRILPVVKTGTYEVNNNVTCKPNAVENQVRKLENDYHMSSGDSSVRYKCCHNCSKNKERCDDCNCNMCCHYQKKESTKEFICKRCRRTK